MTVGELRAILANRPDNADVLIWFDDIDDDGLNWGECRDVAFYGYCEDIVDTNDGSVHLKMQETCGKSNNA